MVEAKDGRLLLRVAGQVRPWLNARPVESIPPVTKINTNTFNTAFMLKVFIVDFSSLQWKRKTGVAR